MASAKRISFIVLLISMALPIAVSAQRRAKAANGPLLEFVTIGDPGQGGVDYVFQMGKYEITNEEYSIFLNAVASQDDPNNLYRPEMTTNLRGGIERRRTLGSNKRFYYQAKAGFRNRPVNFVSWCSAARFANWLHNGKPEGAQVLFTTESGAYHLGPDCSSYTYAPRMDGARCFLPSEAEMMKAGFFDPEKEDDGGFWKFSTRQPHFPAAITVDERGVAYDEPGPEINYEHKARWGASSLDDEGNLTNVGSGGAESASYYGTYDQQGNVKEWTEKLIVIASFRAMMFMNGSYRSTTKGDTHDLFLDQGPAGRGQGGQTGGGRYASSFVGFRMACLPATRSWTQGFKSKFPRALTQPRLVSEPSGFFIEQVPLESRLFESRD